MRRRPWKDGGRSEKARANLARKPQHEHMYTHIRTML